MVDDDLDRGRKRIVKTELVSSMKEIIDGDWRLTVREITILVRVSELPVKLSQQM